MAPFNPANMLLITTLAVKPSFRAGEIVYRMKLLEFTIFGLSTRLVSPI
jgi:hypothetical protein